MAKNNGQIKVYIDPYGNTLNFWWGDPKDSHISEEAEDSFDVVVKNKHDQPIGFEKIGFFPKEIDPMIYLKDKMNFLLEAGDKLI